MSVQNLAIVFGPTLFGQGQPGLNGAINGMADASLQNKVCVLAGSSGLHWDYVAHVACSLPCSASCVSVGRRDHPGALHRYLRGRGRRGVGKSRLRCSIAAITASAFVPATISQCAHPPHSIFAQTFQYPQLFYCIGYVVYPYTRMYPLQTICVLPIPYMPPSY